MITSETLKVLCLPFERSKKLLEASETFVLTKLLILLQTSENLLSLIIFLRAEQSYRALLDVFLETLDRLFDGSKLGKGFIHLLETSENLQML